MLNNGLLVLMMRSMASFLVLTLGACSPGPPQHVGHDTATADDITLPAPDLHQAAKINLSLALAYLKENHLALAHKKLLLAEKQAPTLPRVYTLKGYYFSLIGQQVNAEKAYQQALQLSKNSADVLNSYGVFLCRSGQYKRGISMMQQAIRDPRFEASGLTYQNIGLCQLKQGAFPAALSAFQRALRDNPDLSPSVYYLAYVNLKLNHLIAAKLALHRYLTIASASATTDELARQINAGLSLSKSDAA